MDLRRFVSSLTLGALLVGAGPALADARPGGEENRLRAVHHASLSSPWLRMLDFFLLGDGTPPDPPPKDEPEPEPTEGPQTDPNG